MLGFSAPIRILSFNIRLELAEKDPADSWSGERRHAVLSFLQWVDADIVGLQEVTPSQFNFLRDALAPEYDFVGRGRDADGGGEASPLLFKSDLFSLETSESFWLSSKATLAQPGSKFPDAGCARILTCVRLTRKDGSKFVACCTHLDHVGMSGEYKIQRGQAELLVDCVLQFCTDPHQPCLVMGDFNSIRSAGAPPVLERRGFRDCSDGDEQATFVEFNDSKANSGAAQHIDWLFARGLRHWGYTVYDAKYQHTDGHIRNASDHCPVGCQLRFAEGSSHKRAGICKVSVLLRPVPESVLGDEAMEGTYKIVLCGGDAGTNDYGQLRWELCAHRASDKDQRNQESTYTMLHKSSPSRNCNHFILRKSGDAFKFVLAGGDAGTNDYGQIGWELCAHRHLEADKRNAESSYVVLHKPSSDRSCNRFKLVKIGDGFKILLAGGEGSANYYGQLGWELCAHRSLDTDPRNEESTYVMLHEPSASGKRNCNHFQLVTVK